MSTFISRRNVLRGGLGGLAALAAAPTLAGCSDSSGAEPGGDPSGPAAVLPTYIPYEGVQPDIVGEGGIPHVFFAYPSDPQPATSEKPGDGEPVSASMGTFAPIPPTADRNPYWAELNERVGSELQLSITPGADYPQRFATAVAGDNLGDIFNVDDSLSQLPQFLEAKCQDLTEFLAGDAIADYPFLANLPTDSWRGTVFNGRIYGLPVQRGITGSQIIFTRDDLFEARGVDPSFAGLDEFLQLCRDMTDPQGNAWALTEIPFVVLQSMVGITNEWMVDDAGAFTHALEVPEQKDALEFGRRLVEEGLVHPDGVGGANADAKAWFSQGSAAVIEDTYTAVAGFFARNTIGDAYRLGLQVAPGPDGEPAPMWQGMPNNSFTSLAQADPDRIRLLLQVLNYLAAPFGTEEHLFRSYGIEGVTFEFEGSEPVLTQDGLAYTSNGAFPVEYLVDAPKETYFPGRPDVAQAVYDHQAVAVPASSLTASWGLYSETQGRVGGQLTTMLNDARNGILLGREPVDSWDETVASWKSGGGDDIRAEYEEAHAAQA
ncbi:extracellular solute-binding protein [Occultella glacieicola]|uniref:Extracellular solute-binding protein n=1 Tax=Occultella glacieicola TaxID=2518684 RepID=A0ABY2E9K8_9MICO|nr:extracellular solute-binding protein [Occultella glacieicola]TDE98963.1 extracellular solute-binding protein [Occultella glacieicola]